LFILVIRSIINLSEWSTSAWILIEKFQQNYQNKMYWKLNVQIHIIMLKMLKLNHCYWSLSVSRLYHVDFMEFHPKKKLYFMLNIFVIFYLIVCKSFFISFSPPKTTSRNIKLEFFFILNRESWTFLKVPGYAEVDNKFNSIHFSFITLLNQIHLKMNKKQE
jgi:hypothetical protein